MQPTIYRAEYVLPVSADPIVDGEVLVEDGRIGEVGTDVVAWHPDAAVCDLGRVVLLPGFVNAHSHIDYTMSRNRHDALNLWNWLARVGFRKGKVPGYDLILASARLGAAMCLRSGITCLGDCSFSGVAAEAMNELGLRGVVFREIFGQSMGEDYRPRFARALDEAREMQSAYGNAIRIGLSPHSVYTTNSEVLELCARTGLPIALHLSETRAEAEYTATGSGPIASLRRDSGYEPMASGKSPIDVVREAGLLREGVSLAHCVHLSEDDVALIAGSGSSVVHCPRSNARLGAGVAPIPELLEAGAVVGLGTDSAASCGELDFFDEMRFAVGVHRAVSEDAGVMLAKDVLEMATARGADALGVADTGRLGPGMRADMIAVDMCDILPGEDIHLALMSRSPADVRLVLVGGNPVEADVETHARELRDLMERAEIA